MYASGAFVRICTRLPPYKLFDQHFKYMYWMLLEVPSNAILMSLPAAASGRVRVCNIYGILPPHRSHAQDMNEPSAMQSVGSATEGKGTPAAGMP